MRKQINLVSLILLLIITVIEIKCQQLNPWLGWQGYKVMSDEIFYDASEWNANAQEGNECQVTASDTSLNIHWKITDGTGRWVQIYHVFESPVSLEGPDIFGIDIHGSSCETEGNCHRDYTIEFKLENGANHAVFVRRGEEGLLGVDRWVEKLFFQIRDNDFIIPEGFDWSSINVVSFVIRSYPEWENVGADSGIVSLRNFVFDTVTSWQRSEAPEELDVHPDTLENIKDNAAAFLLGRQKSTGLLTTWEEDGSSWLYGQGLALKALSLEGEWIDNEPVNDYAEAARDLAYFLAANQHYEGFWPRAWNSETGNVIVPYESYDSSIWMGDFPWMIVGLNSYLRLSGDCSVKSAIDKAKDFLVSLIEESGKVNTVNAVNGNLIEVSSSEAYAAIIAALLELEQYELADLVIDYIHQQTWNEELRYWNEGNYSDRIVLFTNTWLGSILYNRGYTSESPDALSLSGRLMQTSGPGISYGLDGIGPVAVWYEGTLSYVSAKGPGSNFLFDTLKHYINEDGSVPHYNDDIGGAAGIWAEKWESLDGTSWLYFTAAGITPFEVVDQEINCPVGTYNIDDIPESEVTIFPNPFSDDLYIRLPADYQKNLNISIFNLCGDKVYNSYKEFSGLKCLHLDFSFLTNGVYYLVIKSPDKFQTKKIIKVE
ncbi:MAG: T9SS type A sorting domain-containing protein [Bacteroidales bacterium]|nr:T9SS type A sorting domain-containing protein [Bacteroidales bacterium]